VCNVNKQKKAIKTFFRSVIHATDSTWTGCNAKIAAANHAPGTFKRSNKRQMSSALAT